MIVSRKRPRFFVLTLYCVRIIIFSFLPPPSAAETAVRRSTGTYTPARRRRSGPGRFIVVFFSLLTGTPSPPQLSRTSVKRYSAIDGTNKHATNPQTTVSFINANTPKTILADFAVVEVAVTTEMRNDCKKHGDTLLFIPHIRWI